jgi:hypothetical protein
LWALAVAAGVASAAAALIWGARPPKGGSRMADLHARIDHLLRYLRRAGIPDEEREACEGEIIGTLNDHPELDTWFLDRYVTRHADEWELGRALMILLDLGRRRPYDHQPLLDLLRRDDVSASDQSWALTNITQLADHLDERVLLDLLDGVPFYLRRSAICDTIDALASVRDRAKAARLLRRCLKATDTTDEETFRSLLDNLVNRIHGNEDIFQAVLRETQVPHETVLLAVSLMKKTLPVVSPYRVLADEAAGRSQLADDYYNYYVGRYVAKDD